MSTDPSDTTPSLVNGAAKTRTVILSDDHTIVRHAVKTILEKSGNFSIIGECESADETVELVEKHSPDFLILDLGLPGKSGLEVIYDLKEKECSTKIAILTMYEDEATVRQAFAAGAQAYLFKNSSPDEFLAAFDTMDNGDYYLPEQLKELRSDVIDLAKASPSNGKVDIHDPLSLLSKREREVFYLLADGMPNRVIAKKLYISPRTVETHRARVIKKLGFSSTADLIRYALRNNLLTL